MVNTYYYYYYYFDCAWWCEFSRIPFGGKSLKKATSMALNADLIKGGYKAYKKIKGNN
jgi:hypothetical protein